MTEPQDETDPTERRMRSIARILAVAWAVGGTVVVVAFQFFTYILLNIFQPIPAVGAGEASVPLEFWVAFLLLSLWLPVLLTRRWESIGGVLLVVEGLLALTLLSVQPLSLGWLLVAFVTVGVPPLAAGILFLASWWTSRRRRSASGEERGRNMTEAHDTRERKAKWTRYIRWGLGLAGMASWTIIFAAVGFASWFMDLIFGDGDTGMAILLGASALALAPWVIAGIVFGVRWRKSRTSGTPPEDECVSISPIMWERNSEDGQNGQG